MNNLELTKCQCYGRKRCHEDTRMCKMQMRYIFTILTPSIALLVFSGYWVFISNEEYDMIIKKDIHCRRKIIDIGKFIIALDKERSSTIGYVTSRTYESQSILKQRLEIARHNVDNNFLKIQSGWPNNKFLMSYGQAFKSPRLFNAVLYNHRLKVNVENRFWEELDFFTKAVEAMLCWMIHISLQRDIHDEHGESFENTYEWLINHNYKIPRWLISHSYLMASLNYLGAEQALCNAFNSVVCFSRVESFTYANISFSGEAMFHMFRLSHPGSWWRNSAEFVRKPKYLLDWKMIPHSSLFPQLHECRQEIMSNAEYASVGIDPSLCDYGRKNESNLKEVHEVLFNELNIIYKFAEDEMKTLEKGAQGKVYLSIATTSCLCCYLGIINCLRLTCLLKKRFRKRSFIKVKKRKCFKLNRTSSNVYKNDSPSIFNPYSNKNCLHGIDPLKKQSCNGEIEERIFFRVDNILDSADDSRIGLFSIFNNMKNNSTSPHQRSSKEALDSTSPLWGDISKLDSKSPVTSYPSLK